MQYADEFLAIVELLYVFLARQKVHEVFMRFQQERGLSQRKIGKLSDTCWACRYRNVLVIKERFGVITDVLGEVQHLGDAEISVQAKGLVQQIESCQFVVRSLSPGVIGPALNFTSFNYGPPFSSSAVT